MMDPKEFAIGIVEEVHQWAEVFVREEYSKIKEPMYGESLLKWLRGHMWREWALGCLPPARIISLMEDSDWDLKMFMSNQIVDEWKHSRIFSKRVIALGGDGSLMNYQPPPEDLQVFYSTYNHDHPAYIATALNCCGEVVLQIRYRVLTDPRSPLVETETAHLIREKILKEDDYSLGAVIDDTTSSLVRKEVIPDEGVHIRFGRMILERYATTEAVQDACRRVVEKKLRSIDAMNKREVANALEST